MNRFPLLTAILISLFCLIPQACLSLGFGDPSDLVFLPGDHEISRDLKSLLNLDIRYQLGSEWGKKAVKFDDVSSYPLSFQKAALATVKVGGATGFYIGEHNGYHLVATNHHVLPRRGACLGRKVKFDMLGKSFVCKKFFGHWTDIDFALFAIDVKSQEDAQALSAISIDMDFYSQVYQGQKLLTIGFGAANNPRRQLVGNIDADCKVFSQAGDYRFMDDPDVLNPGSYKAWSFALGCDVSHGDSGSAIVDRLSGKVVGIIWTGKIPKKSKVQDSAYLSQMLSNNSPEIWMELNYAVPATKIKEVLQNLIDRGNLDEITTSTLQQLLDS